MAPATSSANAGLPDIVGCEPGRVLVRAAGCGLVRLVVGAEGPVAQKQRRRE